ncbi:MAG: D-2-hydroxyacid dehydrogenase [Proteobacteria bacterium]|nr:D-2-hydroxyacid dehydrogenase [Pseudomonadota bacterium]
MKAVFLDFATVGSDELDVTSLRAIVPDLTLFAHTAPEQVAARIAGCEFVFANKVRMTREIIASAEALRFIGLTATGVDNVDLLAAGERKIAVCNIRGYCTNSVVEHVFAVLLQITHSIGLYDRSVRAGDWQRATDFCMLAHPLRELSAMSIGIVGYGELGKGVARIAEAFGMRVRIARRIGQKQAAGDGRDELDDLLRECDVISLHCPLTAETRGLIGQRELGMMKAGAILVNTARGGLVDSAALVAALAGGDIAAAAVDVLGQEPPVDGDPLLDYHGGNLIMTPHIAWASVEARQNAIDEVAKNVRSFQEGGNRNRVV